MPESHDGGAALVRVLREADVDTVFGIVSVHNLPLVQAVNDAMRFVPVRHEAAAVNAADGYARARGGLGCALTSTGTGAGNAAGALIEALTAGSPVLHVTGQIPTTFLGEGRGFIHETKDQAGMLAAVSNRVITLGETDDAAAVLCAAVRDALGDGIAPSGPVSIEWPIDLQYAPSRLAAISIPEAHPTMLERDAIAAAAALLSAAKRPAIWVGGGGIGAAAEITALAEMLGAAVFTSNAGRGTVPETHALCVGNYAATPGGQELLAAADVLLTVGTHFRSNETRTYALRLPAKHIQIDLNADALGRVYPVDLPIWGDARSVVTAIAHSIADVATEAGWREGVTSVRLAVRQAQRADIGAQAFICDAIANALGADGISSRDVTIPSSSWGNRLLPVTDPRNNIFARGGGIGQGLAMGIGAAAGRPDTPTVVIVGDGGLAVHLGELLTLAQEGLPVTVVVFNDGGYGVLRNMQHAEGLPEAGVNLRAPDFADLASAVGMQYALVDDAGKADDVIGPATRSGVPVLVEVDLSAIGPMPRPFVPPVEVPR
jgi:acetolactate synthase I/II/III large subunit